MTTRQIDTPIDYTKCGGCHLFVEPNHGADPDEAQWVHLSRGDAADEEIESTHDAKPGAGSHPLDWWRVNGPAALRARFTDA